jgi:hypothetical protein
MVTVEQAHRTVEAYAEKHGAPCFDHMVIDRGS